MCKKILLVEDDPLMMEVMAYILSSRGYEVYTTANGNEVFNQIRINHPDLVIVDTILPGIDSLEICQLIKLNRATRNLRVIMCSSEDDATEKIMEHKGSPDDVLEKPFDINSLIQKVAHRLAA